MERSSLLVYLKTCLAVKVVCCNTNKHGAVCGTECTRAGLLQHHLSCLLRLVICNQGCRSKFTVSKIAEHNCVTHLKLQNEKLSKLVNTLVVDQDAIAESFHSLLLAQCSAKADHETTLKFLHSSHANTVTMFKFAHFNLNQKHANIVTEIKREQDVVVKSLSTLHAIIEDKFSTNLVNLVVGISFPFTVESNFCYLKSVR